MDSLNITWIMYFLINMTYCMYIIECIWISHLPCFEHIVGPSIRIDGLRDPTPWRGNMHLYHCVYKLECPPINNDSHLQAKRLFICVCFLMKKLRHLCREIEYKCFKFCYYFGWDTMKIVDIIEIILCHPNSFVLRILYGLSIMS